MRKTLGQHETATVQTTTIDQSAGVVNREMKICNRMSVGWFSTLLALAAMVLLACVGFCGISNSQVFAKRKSGIEELTVTHGATYFVAVNGSDNGPGTADRPWATINYAEEKAKAGDTVVVRSGRYVLPA